MSGGEAQVDTVADLDRRLISEEIDADPSFGRRIVAALDQPGGGRAVSLSAKKAVANEFDPTMFPESRGEWPMLRKRAVQLARALPDIVETEIDKLPFEIKMEMVRRIARGEQPTVRIGIQGMDGLGQLDLAISGIISSIAGAASSIYGAKVVASAQKSIANIQAQTAMKDLQTQITIANAQQAIAQAKVAQTVAETQKIQAATTQAEVGTVAGTLTKDIGAGIPLWVLPVALGVLGLVLYFIFKRG
jgi:hypothetical protein